MLQLASILSRLAFDVASTAAWSAVEALESARERLFWSSHERESLIAENRRLRERLATHERCNRIVARARERRMAS